MTDDFDPAFWDEHYRSHEHREGAAARHQHEAPVLETAVRARRHP